MVKKLALLLWPISVKCFLNSQCVRLSPHRVPQSWRHNIRTRVALPLQQQVKEREPAFNASTNAEELVGDLLRCFQGEFDNYDQVVEDRAAGLAAGPGGGHEHIHCSLKLLPDSQLPEQIRRQGTSALPRDGKEDRARVGTSVAQKEQPLAVIAAKYYFNGDASVVFRYRLYSFHKRTEGEDARGDAVMRLWRLPPAVEKRLRAKGYDLTDFDWQDGRHEGFRDSHEVAERMYGCDIYWSRGDGFSEDSSNYHSRSGASVPREIEGVIESHPPGEGNNASHQSEETGVVVDDDRSELFIGGERDRGSGVDTMGPDAGFDKNQEAAFFLGLMGKDDQGTWVSSQNVEGLNILVKDDLKLWPDRLWVNDRGFGLDGNYVYGNQRGVPYKLERVRTPDDDVHSSSSLEWTLGERHRTPELYAEKMAAIGVVPGQRYGPPVMSQQRPDSVSATGGG